MINILKQKEVNRKILHLLFAAYPILMHYTPQKFNITIGISFLAIILIADHWMKYNPNISKLFYRQSELSGQKKFSGGVYIALSSLLLMIFTPKQIFIPSLLAISFCDTLSSLIGRHYGRHKIISTNKSLEGFCGFLAGGGLIYVTCVVIKLHINPVHLLIATIISGFVELFGRMDDNLSVPLAFAGTLYMLQIVLV